MKGIAPYTPPLRQCLRHCHLSRGERQEPPIAGAGENEAWLPPLGELSPQVTERV